jgi:hypothetical protein
MKTFAMLLLLVAAAPIARGEIITKDPVAPDGTPVQIDLPKPLQLRNKVGIDRKGLCVFTSLNHSAYWHNILLLESMRDDMTKYPGGGWPQKVDQMIKLFAKQKGVPVPDYIQVQGADIEVLKLACKTGRCPAITYSYGSRYPGQIAHMVTLLAAAAGKGPDGKGWYCVLDNNYPATYAWLSEAEFRRTYSPGGRGWCVIFLSPGPPPCPKNP